MRPTPRLRTAAARSGAPMVERFIKPFGRVAVGEAIDRKNAVGISFSVLIRPTNLNLRFP
jgi:hypothetical protein